MLLAHAFAGILHVQITLSHFAMDVYSGHTYTEQDKDGWFHTQLMTTLDIKSDPVWTDWFHGGLQFQVVHHVFPRLPRHNLRQARTLLIAFCHKWNIPYVEMGWFDANVKVWKKLRDAAHEVRHMDADKINVEQSMLYEGFHAIG
jgi:delta8-fatty-acid desaturase